MSDSYRPEANRWTEQNDLDLLQGIIDGRSEALGELYDRYGRLVYSLAYAIVGEDGQAEEITQDVFVQVWNKAAQYQVERGRLVTWLASIARHGAIDRLRRLSVRPESRQVSYDADNAPELPDESLLEGEVDLDLERQALRAAMRDLPTEQQEALALAYFKGYTQREIADHTGEALGTIKTRIRLGMKKLRDALEREFR